MLQSKPDVDAELVYACPGLSSTLPLSNPVTAVSSQAMDLPVGSTPLLVETTLPPVIQTSRAPYGNSTMKMSAQSQPIVSTPITPPPVNPSSHIAHTYTDSSSGVVTPTTTPSLNPSTREPSIATHCPIGHVATKSVYPVEETEETGYGEGSSDVDGGGDGVPRSAQRHRPADLEGGNSQPKPPPVGGNNQPQNPSAVGGNNDLPPGVASKPQSPSVGGNRSPASPLGVDGHQVFNNEASGRVQSLPIGAPQSASPAANSIPPAFQEEVASQTSDGVSAAETVSAQAASGTVAAQGSGLAEPTAARSFGSSSHSQSAPNSAAGGAATSQLQSSSNGSPPSSTSSPTFEQTAGANVVIDRMWIIRLLLGLFSAAALF
jgi:hypothetical protein